MVLVDAVAVDKQGRSVSDLTQKDFKIQEDGKDQKISSFALESAALSPDRSQKHYIVLFFDTSTLSASAVLTMRQEASKFVDAFASPDRYMAVVQFAGGLRIVRNLTTDQAQIKAALNTIQGSNTGTTPGQAATFAYSNMMASLRSVADSLAPVKGRKALVLFSGGVAPSGDITDALSTTIDALNKANVAVYAAPASGILGGLRTTPANRFAPVLAALGTLLGASPAMPVASFQGKAPVSISGSSIGAPSGTVTAPNGAAANSAAANSAGNVVSGTDTKAVNQGILRSLADGTGGLMLTASNDLAGELGKVAREQDGYYLLGYTPSVDSPEGTCHVLKVSVQRSGLTVRARKGYCSSKPVALTSASPAPGSLEARAGGAAPGNMTAKMQLPYFYSGPDVARVHLTMDLALQTMKLQKDKGKLHGELDLAGFADKPDGSIASRFSDRVKLDFDNQQQADRFLAAPYRYSRQFEIAPGQYKFQIAFTAGDQNFGKAETPLAIERWDGKALSASGVALSREAHPATDLTAGLDASLLEGAHPFVSLGTEVVPTGTSQFHTGERAFLYFEMYEPHMGSPAPTIALRNRVIDRATGRQVYDSGLSNAGNFIVAGSSVIPVGIALPSAGLPAGAYKLEVSVSDDVASAPVVRTVDFDLI